MATVRWTAQARADVEALSDYYRTVAASYAEAFEEQLFEATRRLEAFPRSGRMIPEMGEEQLREVLYRNYRIMYYVDEAGEDIEILSVLHSAQQFGGFGGNE